MNAPRKLGLNLPDTLRAEAEEWAKRHGQSLDEYVARAVGAKIEADRFFDRSRKPADLEWFDAFMDREGGEPPRPGDELPPGVERTVLTQRRRPART